MERASRDTWAKRIERWKDSGLTATEFATEVGINPRSLRWWSWRLGAAAAAGPHKRRRARRARSSESTRPAAITPLTFVEMPAAVTREELEIVLPTTIRICVRPGFDDATLRRLLDILEPRR